MQKYIPLILGLALIALAGATCPCGEESALAAQTGQTQATELS